MEKGGGFVRGLGRDVTRRAGRVSKGGERDERSSTDVRGEGGRSLPGGEGDGEGEGGAGRAREGR